MEKSIAEVSKSLSNYSRSVKREARLEDYLDSNLLCKIRAKICVKRESKMREKEFDWPVDELKGLVERGETRERDIGAVDLGDDKDVINGADEEAGSDLFGRFEETALKRLRG